jgi:hypothetical protein
MSIVRDMRGGQAQQDQGERSGLAWLIGGVLGAFLIGALAVLGWDRLPLLMQTQQVGSSPSGPGAASVAAAGGRLGEAARAPMLRLCVPKKLLDLEEDADVDLATLYRVLQLATGASRVQAMFGQSGADDSQGIAAFVWSEVADCVYRQNGPAFCDPHNRVFAIEAANAFVRLYDAELAKSLKQHPDAKPKGAVEALQLLKNKKQRVLDALRTRLRDGRLMVADFGYLTPAEINVLVREVKPTRNLCAEEKR